MLPNFVIFMSSGVLNPKHIVEAGLIQDFDKDNIKGNSIDLRVKTVYDIQPGLVMGRDWRRLPNYEELSPEQGSYLLVPGRVYQIEFQERVRLSRRVCALTFLRSTMFKSGSSGETGLFDSGYRGNTGMTVSVVHPTRIELGASIAQMVFLRSHSSKGYDGYYSGRDWRGAQDSGIISKRR